MIKFGSEREKLVEELEIRKLKRVGQFLELLNTEHKNILNQFDKKTQEFRQIIFLKGYTDSTKVNQASEYINTLELKTHFELVAEKAEIEQQLRRLTVFPTIVRCFNLHLSMFNNGNLYVNPLGKVDISIDFVNTASVESGDKDVYANNIPKTSIQCNQLEIKRNLLDLVEDLNVNERLTSLAKVVKRPQNDAKLKSTPTPKNFDQFEGNVVDFSNKMAISEKELISLLECKICLDTYEKPKHLNCGHSFCQECLDGILKFEVDGSAHIKCPLRCTKKTTIDQQETTSSLSTTFGLTCILDEINKDKMSPGRLINALCQQNKECAQPIGLSCRCCGVQICDQCKDVHSCKKASFTVVAFNEKMQNVQPLCKEHNSLARFVCVDCDNKFTCVYCTHRTHKNHVIKSVAEFGSEAKNWFRSFITPFEDTKTVLENLSRKYEEAFCKFKSDRKLLVRELEKRKLKYLQVCIKTLNTEKKNMLRDFDNKFEEFKAKVIMEGYTNNAEINKASGYVNAFESKSNFELISEKVEIERRLRKLPDLPTTIPCFNSHLPVLNNPNLLTLGEMTISIDDINTARPNDGKRDIYKSCITETEVNLNHLDIKCNLVESLCENRELADNGNVTEIKCDVYKENEPTVKMTNTCTELQELIKNGEVKKLQLLLTIDPTFVEMKDDFGNTLLMEAACYKNVLVVKTLIDFGCSVYAANGCNGTVYQISAREGNHDVLQMLINYDATNINNVDYCNLTLLHYASTFGRSDCVKLLLSIPHIDVNIQDQDKNTALHLACYHSHVECVKLLLSMSRINVDKRNCWNKRAYDVSWNATIKNLLQGHEKK